MPVIATLSDLNHILRVRQIDEVIIAIPSAPGSVIRHVTQVCQENRVPSRTMPAIYELLDGKVNVSRLREVEIEDLLRREPTRINTEAIGSSIESPGGDGDCGQVDWAGTLPPDCQPPPQANPALGSRRDNIFEALLLELKEASSDAFYPLLLMCVMPTV